MPWGLWMSVIVLVFFAFFIGTLTLDDNSRTALLILPVWFALLMVIYLVKVRNQPRHLSRREQFTARAKQELAEARAFKLVQKFAGQYRALSGRQAGIEYSPVNFIASMRKRVVDCVVVGWPSMPRFNH